MPYPADLPISQFRLLRLVAEAVVAANNARACDPAVGAVLGHCFGCAKLLPDEPADAPQGLCAECERERVWERN